MRGDGPQVTAEEAESALREGDWERAAETLQWLGRFDEAIAARERAFAEYERSADPLGAAAQARWLAFLHGAVHGNEAAAMGWFGRAQGLLEGLPESAQHGWLAFDRAPLVSDRDEREQLATEALRLGRSCSDKDLEFGALALLGETYVYAGRAAEGIRLIDQAMAAVSSGEVTAVVTAGDIYCRLLSACERTGDVKRAEQWMAVTERFVERSGYSLVSTSCRMHYGTILTEIGRWDEAEQELLAALRVSEEGYRGMRTFPLVRLAALRVRQGRFEEAERLLDTNDWHPLARRSLAAIALGRGEYALAEDLVGICLASEEQADPACAPLLELLVEVRVTRGDLAAAGAAVDALDEIAGRTGDQRAAAFAHLAMGRLATAVGDERATPAFQAAIEGFSSLQLPYDAARARLELARALSADAPAAAIAEARVASREFERLGAARHADAAAALLRRLGDAGGRSWPKGAGELTQREREVLSLLAEGLSNAEIAERLVISRRTAEHHVASILSKLGLRSRAEAAAHAVRQQTERPVAG